MITLPSKVSRGDEVTAAWANKVVDALVSLRPMAGEGTRISQTPRGFIVSSSAANIRVFLPFELKLSIDDTGAPVIKIEPGIVAGFLPSNIFDPISYDPASDLYVWAECNSSDGVISSVSIAFGEATPTPQEISSEKPPSSLKIPIGMYQKKTGETFNFISANWLSPYSVLAYSTTDNIGTVTNWYSWVW